MFFYENELLGVFIPIYLLNLIENVVVSGKNEEEIAQSVEVFKHDWINVGAA